MERWMIDSVRNRLEVICRKEETLDLLGIMLRAGKEHAKERRTWLESWCQHTDERGEPAREVGFTTRCGELFTRCAYCRANVLTTDEEWKHILKLQEAAGLIPQGERKGGEQS